MDSPTLAVKCEHQIAATGRPVCAYHRDNKERMRWEETDCAGTLLRYRYYASQVWAYAPEPPYAASPAGQSMAELANRLDKAAADSKGCPEVRVVNTEGGVKADGGKPMPRLLYISLRKTLASVVKVLSIGARKYSPDNWNKVEQERYWDAFYRHIDAHHSGEMIDPETGEPHLTHALCCLAFISEQRANGKLL